LIIKIVKKLHSSNSTIKSLVIQGYLNGKSRDQIAKETKISTGNVSNTIKEWKMGISIPGIDELRVFAITLKKSGISPGQCARGYRIIKLMKNLGVVDDEEDDEGSDIMGLIKKKIVQTI
jgi:hypothetical protein